MRRPQLSIVIPCYNEEKAIPSVLNQLIELRQQLSRWHPPTELEILVINDSSDDQSLDLLLSHPAQPKVLTNSRQLGYGASIKRGIREAKGDFIGYLDMDDTYPAHEFLNMLSLMCKENLDMISGERLSHAKHMPYVRKVGNVLFTTFCNQLFGARFKDCCTGLRLFHSRYKDFYLKHCPDGLDFALAMTLYSHASGLKVQEHPIHYNERLGESKLGVFREGLRFLKTILSIWIFSLSKKSNEQDVYLVKKP